MICSEGDGSFSIFLWEEELWVKSSLENCIECSDGLCSTVGQLRQAGLQGYAFELRMLMNVGFYQVLPNLKDIHQLANMWNKLLVGI